MTVLCWISLINTLWFFFSADIIPFNHSNKRCGKLVILKNHSTCLLTMAPSWLPRGRLWKYLSDSSSGTFSTDPSTLTCIPHISQLEPAMCSLIGPVIQRGSYHVPSQKNSTACISVTEIQLIIKRYKIKWWIAWKETRKVKYTKKKVDS